MDDESGYNGICDLSHGLYRQCTTKLYLTQTITLGIVVRYMTLCFQFAVAAVVFHRIVYKV